MALNDYEHVDAARKLASAAENIKDVVKDGLDGKDILPLIGEVSTVVGAAQPVLEAETKTEAEVKLFAVAGLIWLAREARSLPDSKLKENLLLLADSGQKALEVNIVDEPNA